MSGGGGTLGKREEDCKGHAGLKRGTKGSGNQEKSLQGGLWEVKF